MKRLRIVLIAAAAMAVGVVIAARTWGLTPGLLPIFLGDLACAPRCLMEGTQTAMYTSEWYKKLRFDPAVGYKNLEAEYARVAADPNASHLERGRLALHRGDFDEAVRELEAQSEKEATESGLLWLGLSYLRQGETVNCQAQLLAGTATSAEHPHLGAMCALPLTMFHHQVEPARNAARVFLRLLDEYDADHPTYRWLLSFSLMTVNAFPDEVPERYRVNGPLVDHFYGEGRRRAEAASAGIVLEDRAHALGVDNFDAAKGVAVEDFDGDGFLDIVTGGNFTPVKFYKNEGGRGFSDRSEASGLSKIRGAHIITAADFDGDGAMDLFVSRFDGAERGDFVLLHNRGAGVFDDVTEARGLLTADDRARYSINTWMSAWADIDLDGDLDLFVCNNGAFNFRLSGWPMRARLFVNEGDHFVERAEAWGLEPFLAGRFPIGATFGDYDGDGDPDLLMSTVARGQPVLFENMGGRFVPNPSVIPDVPGFTVAFLDVNQDGRLDLFYGGLDYADPSIRHVVVGGDDYPYGGEIWLQTDGGFEKDGAAFGGYPITGSMSVGYGDLDWDGAYELYLGTGSPNAHYVLPNLMYRGLVADGQPTGRFESITPMFGLGTIQKGHGIVFFDFDEDGDIDVYSALGGRWPADAWPNQMFVNDSPKKNTWASFRLRGERANRHGVGARLRVNGARADGSQLVRYEQVTNKTGFGSAPYIAYVGLSDAVRITGVDVWWPGEQTPERHPAELGRLNLLRQSTNGAPRAAREGEE